MIIRDPGTRLLLADWMYLGQSNGARGQLFVRDGGECEVYGIRIGYAGGALGRAVVTGSDSVLKNWANYESSTVGWSGNGTLTVQDGGLVLMRYVLDLGYANGSRGEVLVTGNGSRLEAVNVHVGRGDAATLPTPPGEGVLRLARGGVVHATTAFNVGYSSYKPKGTLVFMIGTDGSGSVSCGRADVAGTVLLDVATLVMEVDDGVMELTYTPYEPAVSCQVEGFMDAGSGWPEISTIETRVEGDRLVLKFMRPQYPAVFLRVRIAR